jgi:hypothetical protein
MEGLTKGTELGEETEFMAVKIGAVVGYEITDVAPAVVPAGSDEVEVGADELGTTEVGADKVACEAGANEVDTEEVGTDASEVPGIGTSGEFTVICEMEIDFTELESKEILSSS